MAKCTACRREFEPTYLKSGKAHKCCPTCREDALVRRTANAARDPGRMAAYQKELRRKYRQDAFDAYGGQCACCGEARYEFLVIDHPNGGGRKERELLGIPGAHGFARHLAKLGYPEGYRVLCHNCNSATGYYGYCPHAA